MLEIDLIAEVKSDRVKKFWYQLKIIASAFMASTIIYGIVGFALQQSALSRSISVFQESSGIYNLLRNILVGLSLMVAIASVLLSKKLVKKVVKGDSKSLSAIDSPLAPYLAAYQNYTLIILSMLDSIGVYGLLIYLLLHDSQWFFLLLALSFVLKLFYSPSPHHFIRIMQRHLQNF